MYEAENKKRAAILFAFVWVSVVSILSFLIELTSLTLTEQIVLLAISLIQFFTFITVIVVTDIFAAGVFPYSKLSFGKQSRVGTYRYIGGIETRGKRLLLKSDYKSCEKCNDEIYEGIVEKRFTHYVLFGVQLIEVSSEDRYYCKNCRSNQWTPQERDFGIVDMKYPSNSTAELVEDIPEKKL